MGNKGTKHSIDRDTVLGLVLAGGYSRRMQGPDKADLMLGGQTLLARAVDRMAGEVGNVAISSNNARPEFAGRDIPIIADTVPDRPSPLAGLLGAMEWAGKKMPHAEWLLSASVDTPLVPVDLLDQLTCQYKAGDDALVARSHGRLHPTIGLFSLALASSLRAFLERGERKAGLWVQSIPARIVDFGSTEPDPFLNLNAPEDLAHPAIQNLQDP
jgi:molybdopterin-guanine dinucleotide biosynthesis protein A